MPEIECHKCYKKGHISRECLLKESGYSSGHSSGRMRGYERRTEDRERYEDEFSLSVGTVKFASRDNIIGADYDSLFAGRPSSVKVTKYGRVVKPVHSEGTIYQ